jgi:hypothetical protein
MWICKCLETEEISLSLEGEAGCVSDVSRAARNAGFSGMVIDTRTPPGSKALTSCSMPGNIKAHPPLRLVTSEESGLDVEIAIALFALSTIPLIAVS